MAHRFDDLDDRLPVLVGVGTYPADAATTAAARDGERDVHHLDVLVAAARAALSDAGTAVRTVVDVDVTALAAAIDTISVTEGNWSMKDPAALVAGAIAATRARTVRVDVGVPQSSPLRAFASQILGGEFDVALVVGGEAKATAQRVARAGGTLTDPVEADGTFADEVWSPTGELVCESEIEIGMWDPVQQYACIDNALGHAEGRTIDEQLDEVAALWQRFNAVAADNPLAWFPEPRSAEFLRVAGPGNRPLAFPYAKWHSTQWSVDQGAALLLCSVGAARRLGIDPDRWVFPRVLVDSSSSLSMTKRAEPHRWPAMKVLGDAASAHIGRPLDEVEVVEFYSCFPAAVRVQQRELGFSPDSTPTITGGMPFAGGPFNNFSYQSTAAVAQRLRDRSAAAAESACGGSPGRSADPSAGVAVDPGAGGANEPEGASRGVEGLVTTVSGLLTKPGIAIWSTEPDSAPLFADLGDDAAAATAAVDSVAHHDGDATVVTATVINAGTDAASAFVVADLADRPGVRWVGVSAVPAVIDAIVSGTLVGRTVRITDTVCDLAD